MDKPQDQNVLQLRNKVIAISMKIWHVIWVQNIKETLHIELWIH